MIEFRTDQWAKIYSKRIDETIAALKSKGVPVFWVGLPSIRGTKSTADAVYLNDLYRARAEKAGAVYIDVWDGFVDEAESTRTSAPTMKARCAVCARATASFSQRAARASLRIMSSAKSAVR